MRCLHSLKLFHSGKILLFVVSAIFVNKCYAQDRILEWRLPPSLDSFTSHYLDSTFFYIYNKGKVGAYHRDYGLMVPPIYDKVSRPAYFISGHGEFGLILI